MKSHDGFFAGVQSSKRSSRLAAEYTPTDYSHIASGGFGEVYRSDNSTTVLKVLVPKKGKYHSDNDAISEFNILERVACIAPDYVPVPSMLTCVKGALAIQMPNVGDSISTLLPSKQPGEPVLEPNEIALCILQSIDFLFLLNYRVKLGDLHVGNICVQRRKADIRLRFIDVGMWSKYESIPKGDTDYSEETSWIDVIVNNTRKMFWDEERQEGLWCEVVMECMGKGKYWQDHEDKHFIDLMNILESFKTDTNIFTALLNMARKIQTYIGSNKEYSYISSAELLLQKIQHSHLHACLSLRPSPFIPRVK